MRLDLFITLLHTPELFVNGMIGICRRKASPRSLGVSGWTGLLQERKDGIMLCLELGTLLRAMPVLEGECQVV